MDVKTTAGYLCNRDKLDLRQINDI